jgi:negative regulator of replication initiation
VKTLEVSDEVHAALARLAAGMHRAPEEVLASLLVVPAASPEAAEPLAGFILSGDFRAKYTEADRYLALLGWLAERHPADFGEFIRSLPAGRRGHELAPEEIIAACRRNQARQIDGTQFWAIMNLEPATRRHFLARALEFLGYREEVIAFAAGFVGPTRPAASRSQPSAAA